MTTRRLAPSDVFINLPFDSDYEPLFLAIIAGLVSLGLNPRSVIQIVPSYTKPSQPRVEFKSEV